MTFKKGVSGNPRGRPRKGLTLTDRLHKALNRKHGGLAAAEIIVNAAVKRAAQGDMRAIEWVADRADGKVTVPVEMSQVTLVMSQDDYDAVP